MKIAILSDIHANIFALDAVLKQCKSENVIRLIVLGDLVGYYYWPAAVMSALADWDCTIIKGNHEVMLEKAIGDSDYRDAVKNKYGSGIECAITQLQPSEKKRLISLPHPLAINLNGLRILLAHGSPWNIDQYLYPDSKLDNDDWERYSEFNIIFTGHTHYPMQRKLNQVLIINPGSVGQPRNHSPGAHFGILDLHTQRYSQKLIQYDAQPILEAVNRLDPNIGYLSKVLLRC